MSYLIVYFFVKTKELRSVNYTYIITVNIALNKPTYQQYPFKPGDDIYDSSNAVDGLKTNLNWNGGQCVYSNSKETATLWVNLTSIHSIHHTTIYFRTDGYPWGIYFQTFYFCVHIITALLFPFSFL